MKFDDSAGSLSLGASEGLEFFPFLATNSKQASEVRVLQHVVVVLAPIVSSIFSNYDPLGHALSNPMNIPDPPNFNNELYDLYKFTNTSFKLN